VVNSPRKWLFSEKFNHCKEYHHRPSQPATKEELLIVQPIFYRFLAAIKTTKE
jgi:hypothetical protein